VEKTGEGLKAAHEKEANSSLVKPVSWAQLAQPTKALYRTQTIHGILTHDINSDVPGQIKILVTRPVMDELNQGTTVIEQFSYLLGLQAGAIKPGTQRLDVTFDQIQTPSKVLIDLGKARLADKSGAAGGQADVNNHYGRVLLGAGISAVLSIGARSVAGSPSGFQPTIQQDFAKDVAGSINTSGQKVVEQQLNIAPTLTMKAGEPVSIQILENFSFQTPQTLVTK
jgi:type IV secretory pathway VirB10-like protein